MNLADHLRSWPAEALARLMTARPDLLTVSDRGFAAVARKASSPMSLGRCLIRADVGMLVVAEALTVANPATAAELDDLLGADDLDGVLDALLRLQQVGVILVEDGVARPVGALSDLLHRPLGLGPSFVELAGHLPDATVSTLADLVGAAGASRPAATARAIARRLSTPDGLARALTGATPAIVELVGSLAERRSPAIALPAGFLYRQPDPDDPLHWLLKRGLVVAVNEGLAELAREVVIGTLTDGLAPGASLRPLPLRPVDGLAPDAVAATAADRAGRTLEVAETLVRLAGNSEIQLRRNGGIGVREIRRLTRLVDATDRDVARVLELLRWARLIEARSDGTVTATELAPVWFGLERSRRWLVLVRSWFAAPVFPSSALSTGLDGKPVPALAEHDQIPATTATRSIVVTTLAGIEPGQAFAPEQLAEVVVWQAPNLWGVGDPEPEELVSWLLDELELLGLVADRAPVGLVAALAAGDQETLEHGAAALLGGEQDQVVLQSDLTAVALGPLRPTVAGVLGELADRTPGLSLPSFRFSETSLRRAFDRGWTAESVEEFLTTHALSGLPQPLRYLIADVARRYGSTRVLPARSVIVTGDEAEAVEIATTVRAARIGLRLIAPTVLTSPLEPHQMVDELRAEGLFPVLDGQVIGFGRRAGNGAATPGDRGGAETPPADWIGADLGGQVLPDEVAEAVEALHDDVVDAAPPTVGHPYHLVWNRPAVVTHLRDGHLVESVGVLVSVDDSLALLGEGGVEELPIDGVVSIEDPSR